MLTLTKIFHFEMAHAIHGYAGACKDIHGHSYELHVTVAAVDGFPGYVPVPGFIIDFKEIKNIVKTAVTANFDHRLVLSRDFIKENPYLTALKNLVIFEVEPTAENLLIYIKQAVKQTLPGTIKLVHLLLFETKGSYAEWTEPSL